MKIKLFSCFNLMELIFSTFRPDALAILREDKFHQVETREQCYFSSPVKISINKYCNFFLSSVVDVDVKDGNERTPLHVAAQHGHTPLVKLLLEKNADMKLKDDDGNQPIHLAIESDHHEYVNQS